MSDEAMHHRLSRALWKCFLALVWIAGTAGLIVLASDGDVPTSDADILGLSFGRADQVETFENVLTELGHDEPQVYALNGNTTFFSVRHTRRSPRALLREYQDAFVRAELNDRAYYELSQSHWKSRMFTSLKGGVVPQSITPDHVVMGGVLMRDLPETDEEVLEGISLDHDETEAFRGHRWVEIFREPGVDRTTVIASWSDSKFRYDRMLPDSEFLADPNLDREVPTCPGCTRVHHFEKLGDQNSRVESVSFVGPLSIRQLRPFYVREMESRGWKLDPTSNLIAQVRSGVRDETPYDVLVLRRNDDEVTITIYQTLPDETAVHVARTEKRSAAVLDDRRDDPSALTDPISILD